MKLKKLTYRGIYKLVLTIWIAVTSIQVNAQELIGNFDIIKKSKKPISIPFKMIHNLILIPIRINNSDTLQFVLDTGVSTTIITGLPNGESLSLNYTKEMDLSGLGEGESIKALYSTGNTLSLPGAVGYNHEVLFLLEDVFHLSSSMGTFVHGLIGYDVFRNFVVEVNYVKERLILHDPNRYNRRIDKRLSKGKKLKGVIPISIEKSKPYLNGKITQKDGAPIDLKLLVDSGASHAISLYSITHDEINVPTASIRSFLGAGLSGDIYGDIARVEKFQLGKYKFDELVATFPEMEGIKRAVESSDRNGSIGSEILKRFKVVFNYKRNYMMLKPNRLYKKPFHYNVSGIEITTPVPGVPIYEISKIREDSPAKEAGLTKGDQIIMINGVNVTQFTLNEVIDILQNRTGRKVKIFVQRYNKYIKAEFLLNDKLVISQD
ncbi:PDZ domain-containing protein [Chondrinema litorale]|uniref:PDZ domain-containing protein n=1 Tax=Chondrinema litorale TaxID=2994555 RepID=UPI002543F7F5|nr:PDZ domain-containing protein [Chondrinema litorale]UZR95548.1 aspartyl protease family protein [Chondrinema litorale]